MCTIVYEYGKDGMLSEILQRHWYLFRGHYKGIVLLLHAFSPYHFSRNLCSPGTHMGAQPWLMVHTTLGCLHAPPMGLCAGYFECA